MDNAVIGIVIQSLPPEQLFWKARLLNQEVYMLEYLPKK